MRSMKASGPLRDYTRKIVSLPALVKVAAEARRRGRRIVTTNGCFDLLHVGHVRNIFRAKQLGDILIVGINSDSSARRNKPRGRPIIPARERAEMVAALTAVDYVYIFNERTPDTWLKSIRPHIHAKGSDRSLAEVVERQTVESFGGTIALIPHTGRHSTTRIIKKIQSAA